MFSFNLKSAFSFLILATTSATLLPVNAAAIDSYVMAKTVSTGDFVRINTYNTTLNLRNAPCGNIIGSIASMSTGRVAASEHNTHKMSCNGGNWTWVKVDFANVSGFVAAEYLLKLDNTMPKVEYKKVETPRTEKTLEYHLTDKETQKVCIKHNWQNCNTKSVEMPKTMPNSVWMTGSKVSVDTAMVPVQVRSTPCGNRIALAHSRAVGTLMYNANNFVKATCNGGTHTWLDVDFGGGVRGWVAREYLKSSVNI